MKPVHISIVLDRSGSMASIAADMVGGFNQFLRNQRETQGEARVTLAQFDSEDPFEVLIDGIPLEQVEDLDQAAYQPRATTPLYDAVGRMIVRIDKEIEQRAAGGLPGEDQLVLIITDGMENSSTRYTRAKVFQMISERREQGWVFVFLGADQDVYAEGDKVGVAVGNRVRWDKSRDGSDKMWRDISYSTEKFRAKEEYSRRMDAERFHEEAPGEDE
jgi:Mg-chelatase subunit ChlD